MTAKITAGSASVPDSEPSASTRKTGISASRTKPIALGIVQTFHGWSRSVCGGGGPGAVEARRAGGTSGAPARRACAGRDGSLYGIVGHSSATASTAPSSGTPPSTLLQAAADLRLRARRPSASAARPSAAAGSRAARRRRTSRPARRRGRRAGPRSPAARSSSYEALGGRQLVAARPCRARRPRRPTARAPAATRCPCSSANCSTAAAAIRAGPIP